MSKEARKALLLAGSQKSGPSTSESLGRYLLGQLSERGVSCRLLKLVDAVQEPESIRGMLQAVRSANLLLLSSPLYFDSHPSVVIRAMELIADDLGENRGQGKDIAAVMNCGLPEAGHNQIALQICHRFAVECGFRWCGGLELGMGEAIGGKPLQKAGFKARRVRKALRRTADALAAGERLPPEPVALMTKPMLPKWLYRLFGHRRWKKLAKKHGTRGELRARPYRRKR